MATSTIDFSDLGGKVVQPAASFASGQKMDFSDLGGKVVQPAPSGATATISAEPASTGWRDNLSRWADNVASDLKYGTDLTGVGTVLKKMGAHGVYSGNSEAVGDFMASLPLGLLRATKGAGEVTQSGQIWQGTKDIAGGLAQAATIPASFMAPEAAEATAAMPGKVAATVLPSAMKARAGVQFTEAATKAGDVVIDVAKPGDAVLRIKQLQDAGNYTPQVIRKFFNRVTDPNQPAMAYNEARDFYSTVSRLSADEYNKMTPVMKAAMGEFRATLGQSIQNAANAAGVGDQYANAMQLYRTAARNQQWLENAAKLAKWGIASTAAGTVAGYAFNKFAKLSDLLTTK